MTKKQVDLKGLLKTENIDNANDSDFLFNEILKNIVNKYDEQSLNIIKDRLKNNTNNSHLTSDQIENYVTYNTSRFC